MPDIDNTFDFLTAPTELNIDEMTLEGTMDEGLLFLAALSDECSPEEFQQIVTECAHEFEVYGLISSADVVLEAQKNIVRLNKYANFNKVQKRTALRLAENAKDQMFEKYAKFRKLMIGYRLKIYAKYGNKSKIEARKSIANAKRKASGMKSPAGKSIVEKMDHQISKLDRDGRNGSAIKD